MADVEELEQRLAEALRRIAAAQVAAQQAEAETAGQIATLMDENAVLESRLSEKDAAGSGGGDTTALQEALEVAEQALEAERRERESQAEALSKAITEQTLLMESRDAAEQAREELAERAQRLAERETLRSAEARSEMDTLRDRIDTLEAGADQLREANRQLRSNNAALRAAHASGVADPDLINAGLQAELDALTAVRAADRAELDGVLAALRPILEEATDA